LCRFPRDFRIMTDWMGLSTKLINLLSFCFIFYVVRSNLSVDSVH